MARPSATVVDEESRLALYEGLNISQLTKLFRQDYRSIQEKITAAGIKPVGRRHNADIYAVHEVAPYIVKPVFDAEAYIRKMDPRELPKMLSKEYWAGQRSRQEYELRAGNLWPTEKVVSEVGELMKIVKMSTLLMLDGVERQTELSDRQREMIRSLAHGMLDDLVKRIEEKFKPTPQDADGQLHQDIDGEEL